MGSLQSDKVDCYEECQERIAQGDQLREEFLNQLCSSDPEYLIQEVKTRMLPRAEKGYAALLT